MVMTPSISTTRTGGCGVELVVTVVVRDKSIMIIRRNRLGDKDS